MVNKFSDMFIHVLYDECRGRKPAIAPTRHNARQRAAPHVRLRVLRYSYTVSQKTPQFWLATTLTHVNGF